MKSVKNIIKVFTAQSNPSISATDLIGLSKEDLKKIDDALLSKSAFAQNEKKRRRARRAYEKWKSLCIEVHKIEGQKKAKSKKKTQKVIQNDRASNFAGGISNIEDKSIMNDLKKFSIPILLLIILVTIITASAENLDEQGTAFTVLAFVASFSIFFCVLSWFVIALSESVKEFSSSLFGARVLVAFHIWTLIMVITGVNLSPIEIEGSEYFCQTIGGETTCYTDQDMDNLIDKALGK